MTATANNAKWLGVREIYINEVPEKEEVETSLSGTYEYTSRWTVYAGNTDNLKDNSDTSDIEFDTGADDNTVVGDYIGITLSEAQKIGTVRIVVGGQRVGSNKWKKYHIAYS